MGRLTCRGFGPWGGRCLCRNGLFPDLKGPVPDHPGPDQVLLRKLPSEPSPVRIRNGPAIDRHDAQQEECDRRKRQEQAAHGRFPRLYGKEQGREEEEHCLEEADVDADPPGEADEEPGGYHPQEERGEFPVFQEKETRDAVHSQESEESHGVPSDDAGKQDHDQATEKGDPADPEDTVKDRK